MSAAIATFTLSYTGESADDHEIDLYDLGKALTGFQRSLALTTHLVLNGEVIAQATALKGASVFARPAEEGSWKLTAAIALASGIYTAGTAPRDTPVGHLVSSAYDYVISETLGFRVDYDKTLGLQLEEQQKQSSDTKPLKQSQFDSVIEKCDIAIRDMHRPIYGSETATLASVTATVGSTSKRTTGSLSYNSYEYVIEEVRSTDTEKFSGMVSSYNINTYKGRIFLPNEARPIPFELGDTARDIMSVTKVVGSLQMNAQSRFQDQNGGSIKCVAFRNTTKSGRLKSLFIVEIIHDER